MDYSFFDYLLMFVSNFCVVFLLGIQSKNVQRSKIVAAIVTSFGISIAQFLFVKYAAAGHFEAFVVCAIGGCFGIAFSIWFSDNVLHRPKRAAGGLIAALKPEVVGERGLGYIAPPDAIAKLRASTARLGLAIAEWEGEFGEKTVSGVASLSVATATHMHQTGHSMPDGECK